MEARSTWVDTSDPSAARCVLALPRWTPSRAGPLPGIRVPTVRCPCSGEPGRSVDRGNAADEAASDLAEEPRGDHRTTQRRHRPHRTVGTRIPGSGPARDGVQRGNATPRLATHCQIIPTAEID